MPVHHAPRGPRRRMLLTFGSAEPPRPPMSRRARRRTFAVHWPRLATVLLFAALVSATGARESSAVVGGNQAAIESAPWTVAVMSSDPAPGTFVCSGVIVDALHIVTAAHCLKDGPAFLPATTFAVRAGVSNFATPLAGDAVQDQPVVSFRVHPEQATAADIAVLELGQPLQLDGVHVSAIALSHSPTWPAGERVRLTGFGRQDPGQISAGPLAQIDEQLHDHGTCGQRLLPSPEAATWVCASSPLGSVCFGDSGAGLVASGSQPLLIGIADTVEGNCEPGARNQYTYLGAGEVWRFVLGDDNPPLAPHKFEIAFLGLTPVRVGEPIYCGSTGAGKAETHYTLSRSRQWFLGGTAPLFYRVRKSDVGKQLTCRASATNDGGTAVQARTSPPVRR